MKIRNNFLLGLGVAASLVACTPKNTAGPTQPLTQNGPGGDGAGAAAAFEHDDGKHAGLGVAETDREALGTPFMFGRVRNPDALIKTAGRLAGVDSREVAKMSDNFRGELIREIARGSVDRRAVAKLVVYTAPIDMVGALSLKSQKLNYAWSVGVSSLEAVKDASKGGAAREIAPGVWKLGAADAWRTHCAVLASKGAAPARLVCSERESALVAMASYMANDVVAMPDKGSDIHLELRMRDALSKHRDEILKQLKAAPRLAKEGHIGDATFDAAIDRAAVALAEEVGLWVDDGDNVTLSANLTEGNGLKVKMNAKFAGNKSWMVRQLIATGAMASPPPASFWKLPADSMSALWGHGGDPAALEGIATTLGDLAFGAMNKYEVAKPADRAAVRKLFRFPGKKFTPIVSAQGVFKGLVPKTKLPEELARVAVGWQLYGFDDSSTEVIAHLNEMVAAYNRPAIQAALRKEISRDDLKQLPRVTKRRAFSLGAGATAYTFTIAGVKFQGERPVNITASFLVAPDGDRTWVAMGMDERKLTALVKNVIANKNSLATSNRMTSLKSARHAAGMATTVEGLWQSVETLAGYFLVDTDNKDTKKKLANIVNGLPNKGQDPITVFFDAGNSPPRWSLDATVGRASIDDIRAIITKIIKLKESSPPPVVVEDGVAEKRRIIK